MRCRVGAGHSTKTAWVAVDMYVEPMVIYMAIKFYGWASGLWVWGHGSGVGYTSTSHGESLDAMSENSRQNLHICM